MLRRSQTFLRVSPYALFLRDMKKTGTSKKFDLKKAAVSYRRLSPNQKRQLVRRADATTFPRQQAYLRFAKREWKNLANVPLRRRHALLREKWASVKSKTTPATKVATKVASAKSKVKAAGKKAKKTSKRAKK
ncbi:kinetoplast-associated protein p18-2 [Novymonas esmeraldas]|uniref:Kinetoplast-associated protein p18-2 n=1 Tax=Novymonas esmeraldas TaxID=1808958 RepID=A0AAW0F066_9TRYP